MDAVSSTVHHAHTRRQSEAQMPLDILAEILDQVERFEDLSGKKAT